MPKEKIDPKILTANEYTDVRDIIRGTLMTKSGNSIGFLRLHSYNIDLLSKSEKESICDTLSAELKPETDPFIVYSIPRTVDMEEYINFLNTAYDNEIINGKRKMLLNVMINDATDTVMNGQNFEHQFFVKVWDSTDKKNSRSKLDERLSGFARSFATVGNDTKRLDDVEVLKLCNLFGNSNTAAFEEYDENIYYTKIPLISDSE